MVYVPIAFQNPRTEQGLDTKTGRSGCRWELATSVSLQFMSPEQPSSGWDTGKKLGLRRIKK